MPDKRSVELFIVDIFVAIQKIKHYTQMIENADDFLADHLRWDACIRNLEIIGEASNNLLKDEIFNSYSPKYFRQVVNFRNMISHAYFGISHEEVWDVVTEKIDILETDLKKIALEKFVLDEAIEQEIPKQTIIELKNYLIKLKRAN